jgi:hypothetical protein
VLSVWRQGVVAMSDDTKSLILITVALTLLMICTFIAAQTELLQ